MVKIALGVLSVAAMSAAVQVGYVAPAATGYIYRSDNDGPASLIQLGAHAYEQPAAFAAPLPIAEPLKAFEAYQLGPVAPVPLPYIAAQPIVVEDAVEDGDDDEDSDYLSSGDLVGLGHGHGYEKGAGSDYGEEHHSAHGEKGSKGYDSKGHHAEGESGHYGKEHSEGFHSEGEGEKGSHHDEADAYGKHHESGESYEGGDHGHKKHFSKGEDVTGYHKVFHKDEFKKDHDFYDVADNSGHFNKHGYEKEHHGSEEGAHKEGGQHDSGFDKGEFGKEGYHAKGHVDDADANHSAEEGVESHYSNEAEFGKKGGASQEKEYLYDDDDDDDEY
ncbi:hypothetical protein ABMA27_007837 [Loxostege sticticalis]|uniref:Uncharacterized protein n=1 Tax=Loxostege sticticalis TaxID=481309 RepID=A0ABR3HD15_LOXSC